MKNTLKLHLSILLLGAAFSIVSCKKNGEENNADLNISFQNQVNGTNIPLNQSYRNAANVDVNYETFQFYLSDITIVNSNGDGRLVSEIELFKFDATGKANLDFRVPFGDYESIQFGIGVKKTLNEMDPSTFSDADHPLNITQNTYWGWASMYRFIMMEGRYDANLDGVFEGTFAYHTGREGSYRTFTLSHDFKIDKKDQNNLNFNIDLFQLLEKSGNSVNVVTEPYYHGGTENEDISTRISDNMVGAIKIAD
jgi:hypothetical protein